MNVVLKMVFAIIVAVLVVSLFWKGVVIMLAVLGVGLVLAGILFFGPLALFVKVVEYLLPRSR